MNTFSELNLPESLSHALNSIGFVEPTPIQKKAIPALLQNRDLLACSETGSGKTGAYLIPMVKALLENPKEQGMILAPTRELAQQISEFMKSIVPDDRLFHTTRLVGGQDIRKQFKSLQKKPRIIVATPGRLIDHLKRNTIQIHKVKYLVLDEGDRMIDMGFAPQLNEILKHLPEERQTSFFTATLDDKVKGLTKKYLKNPESLMMNNSKPVNKIKQSVVQVEFAHKDECIVNELNNRQGSTIVFLKTKYRTDRLKKYLDEYGFSVEQIHGGRTQGQRNRAIRDFKKGKIRILCATDVAARGIDVPQVEHVINFDLPMQDEDYVHRVGRTARNGAEGEAVSFVTPEEHNDWNRLVKKYAMAELQLEPSSKKKVVKGRGKKKSSRFAKDKKTFRNSSGEKVSGKSSGKKASGKSSAKKASGKSSGESSRKNSGKFSGKPSGKSFGKKKSRKSNAQNGKRRLGRG